MWTVCESVMDVAHFGHEHFVLSRRNFLWIDRLDDIKHMNSASLNQTGRFQFDALDCAIIIFLHFEP